MYDPDIMISSINYVKPEEVESESSKLENDFGPFIYLTDPIVALYLSKAKYKVVIPSGKYGGAIFTDGQSFLEDPVFKMEKLGNDPLLIKLRSLFPQLKAQERVNEFLSLMAMGFRPSKNHYLTHYSFPVMKRYLGEIPPRHKGKVNHSAVLKKLELRVETKDV